MMSLSGRVTEAINRCEHWIEARPRPLLLCPLRLAASIGLLVLLMAANLAAVARWPFSAICRAANSRGPAKQGEPLHVDAESLEQLCRQEELVLVDFWAEWCGPCLLLGAVLRDFAAEHAGEVVVAKVDTTLHPGLAKQFQVSALPTLVLLRGSVEAARHVGPLSPQQLSDFIRAKS